MIFEANIRFYYRLFILFQMIHRMKLILRILNPRKLQLMIQSKARDKAPIHLRPNTNTKA